MTDYSAKHRAVKAELARRRLLDFTTWTKPDYQIGNHHRLVCKYLDKLVCGEIKRLMLFMPPRHGKSELVSRRLPAYYLGKNPDDEVIVTAYSADLANRMNRDVQRIIDTPAYAQLFPETRLSGGLSKTLGLHAQRKDDFFELVNRRGSLRSAGVGGGIGGMGGKLLIGDDLFKNFEESHSPTIRENVDEWWCSTFWTRQAPDARILLTQTRWHEDDQPGRLIRRMLEDPHADQWTILRLPAVADKDLHPEDRRVEGEVLWPERFDATWMAGARASLGSYLFTGMYQQTPTNEGGNHFKEAWFVRRWRKAGDWYLVQDGRGNWEKYAAANVTVFATVDPAASEKETADHTAIGVWAVTPHNDLLLLEMVNERLGIDRIVPKLLEVCQLHRPGWVAFEATGFQLALVRDARKKPGMPPIREISHEGKGKLVRATPAIILAESGKIVLPYDNNPWVKPFVDQLCRFTGLDDKEDDQVDVTAYAVWHMPRLQNERQQPKAEEEPHVAYRPGHDSRASERGLWGRR